MQSVIALQYNLCCWFHLRLTAKPSSVNHIKWQALVWFSLAVGWLSPPSCICQWLLHQTHCSITAKPCMKSLCNNVCNQNGVLYVIKPNINYMHASVITCNALHWWHTNPSAWIKKYGTTGLCNPSLLCNTTYVVDFISDWLQSHLRSTTSNYNRLCGFPSLSGG